MGARWWSSGLVIMGRALDAGSPFHDNGFSNRPIGGAPARSGQVIMGRAVGSGSPARSGAPRGRSGGCQVIMGRALGGRIPVTQQWILESTNWERASAERPGDHGACGRARMPGEVRGAEGAFRRVPGDHGACGSGAGYPLRGNGFSNRPIGHAPARSGRGVHGWRAVRGLALVAGWHPGSTARRVLVGEWPW